METLSERQQVILRGVVEIHIETSLPVGSCSVAQRYPLFSSPATIRNEMGALEEMGYLTHPHTSSGRIPTDHGYRYYLDHNVFEDMEPQNLFEKLSEELYQESVAEQKVEDFLERISSGLSSLTQEVGLMLLPIPDSPGTEEADRLRLSLQGLSHILEKPEFQDVQKVKNLIYALEEKNALKRWLLKNACGTQKPIVVSIGREHEHEALEDCAIIMARYSMGDQKQGTLAILGPKRMAYRRMIPLVSQMAMRVGELLQKIRLEGI